VIVLRCVFLLLLLSQSAFAAAPGDPEAQPAPGATLEQPSESPQRMQWDYPRFRIWQYALTAATAGYFTYSVLSEPRDIGWSWRKPLPGDKATRNALVADGQEGRRKAKNRSDRLWHITEFYPVVDSLVTTLAFDHFNTDVAWQMTMINVQGLAVMGAVNRLTHDHLRRDRPALRGCEQEGPEYSHYCQSESAVPRQSFLSGHSASVFFGASATCAHHFAFPMYGHPVADVGICVLGLAAATTTGALRIVTDAHWMSDVVAGSLAGIGAGWGMAYGLHYAWPLNKMQEAGMMLLPVATEEKVELTLLGTL
jgi:hypothetical protein